MTAHPNPPNQPDALSLLLGAGAAQEALAAHLDSISAEDRVTQVRHLSGREQRELFERCAGAPAFTLQDLVPADTTPGQTVIYAGKNSLPAFRLFQKRFTRTAAGAVVGYNYQTMSPITGPGYFTVTEAGPELLFDYTKVPQPGEQPAEWPKVKGNGQGFSVLVYNNLHDFCRRVSQDVIIGRATRLGKPMNQYFVLARA